ncbi:hypothetical protein BT69DRAFT_1306819, partial [Atractiella rhizophila]
FISTTVSTLTPGITERNFVMVAEHLQKLKYTGPLGISVDDTECHPDVRPCNDIVDGKKIWYFVGGVGEPKEFTVETREQVLREVHGGELATKIRLYLLNIPLPDIPPTFLALLPISSKNPATALATLQCKLFEFIAKTSEGAHIRGYTPRQQNLLVTLQDYKHGVKTAHNNGTTGAQTNQRPLLHRNIEGSDRQDDRSAARVFSALLLEHLVETRSEELGLIVYNFVHGELLDAWENRRLQLIERVEMALRAKFFLA